MFISKRICVHLMTYFFNLVYVDGAADMTLSILSRNSVKTMLGWIVAPKSGLIEILK